MKFDLNSLVRPNIKRLQGYSSARDEFKGTAEIFLDANENPFGEYNRYPDPYQKKLKDKLSEVKGVPAANIFIGNGSDEVIDLAFRIFCNPGKDKILTLSPTYGMYDVSAGINDIEVIKVGLDEDFQIKRKALLPHLSDSRIKVLFLCSPNNPTGNCLDSSDIAFILENFNGIVMIDEAYIDFAKENSWSNRIEEFPNLIVSQTFSKAWGLAAARVGIAYMSYELIRLYNKVKPPYNVSRLNQEAAFQALQENEQKKAQVEDIIKERKRLELQLPNFDFVKKVYPSDANFLLVETKDADELYNYLAESKVVVRNRNKVVKNCLRFTVGTAEENNILIEKLNAYTKLTTQA